MANKVITLTLSDLLYEKTQRLVDEGLFADLDEAIRAGLRQILLEAAIIEGQAASLSVDEFEQYRLSLRKLRQGIAQAGGLFPDKTSDEVIETLRRTRDEIYEEKYAPHFRHQ